MTGFSLWRWLFLSLHIALAAELIDVVIPCHAKDYPILEECVRGIRDHGEGIRRVIVVTSKRSCGKIKALAKRWNVEIFFEENFPFTLLEVGNGLGCLDNRGWYYQQLLKLYAFFVIPDLTRHILLLDADTIFLNYCQFVTDDGRTLFTPGIERHEPYFSHACRLLPTFQENAFGLSGICNFMVIRRDVVERLFYEVQAYHQDLFWRVFLRVVDPEWRRWVGASEYEIYFNYFLQHYPREYCLQHLCWDQTLTHIGDLEKYRKEGYHFVTCHEWQRK